MKRWMWLFLIVVVSCGRVPAEDEPTGTIPPTNAAVVVTPGPEASATATARPAATATAVPETLAVKILYPVETTPVDSGQPVRLTAQVFDASGRPVTDAALVFTVRDGEGEVVERVEAVAGNEGVYRSRPWPVAQGRPVGKWQLAAEATRPGGSGRTSATFPVTPATSDVLLRKYGFWIDAPTLGGIAPTLAAERGDAENGMILWGGVRTGVHLLPAAWVEIHWRSGQAELSDEAAVRHFLLAELGAIGFTPIRALGPYHPYQFKQWDGWRVEAQAQFEQDDLEWVVFYAPEVDKTFAISTLVVLPPTTEDPHALLRESFAVHPEIAADGMAPQPLAWLLPGPMLLSPALGERFYGSDAEIVLRWEPLKELAEDEYYEVTVDYNYREDNPKVRLVTRETQIRLPAELYATPNCHVFNWQVVLKRQTEAPQEEALSYKSLYRYLWWLYPPGEKEPYPPLCPNAQF